MPSRCSRLCARRCNAATRWCWTSSQRVNRKPTRGCRRWPRRGNSTRRATGRTGAFVEKSIPTVRAAAPVQLPPLTEEQAEAVATDEDVTLVLAGAGTGKTAVILAKVAHLVQNVGVSPTDILVLAYNRSAAAEIRTRLPRNLTGTHVSTIHAFGYRVIAESGVAPTISKLASDDRALEDALHHMLEEFLQDPGMAEAVIAFLANGSAPYRSPFDFGSPPEYDEYVHHAELRTLSGDLVRSFEEMAIANFLTASGVRFEYEAQYEHRTATSDYRQYQPDFYLPDYGIYIEHFALDERRTPTAFLCGIRRGRCVEEADASGLRDEADRNPELAVCAGRALPGPSRAARSGRRTACPNTPG